MSAYICDQSIFATLGAFAALTIDNLDAQAAADCLAAENVRSVNYRYNENETAAPVDLSTAKANPSRAELLEMISEYSYQACECEDYSETAAALLVERLRSYAIAYIPNDTTAHDPAAFIGAPLFNERYGRRGYVVSVKKEEGESYTVTAQGLQKNDVRALGAVWLPGYGESDLAYSEQPLNGISDNLSSRYNWPAITPAQAALLLDAHNSEQQARQEKKAAARAKKGEERAAFTEKVAQVMPANVKGVIIAEFHSSECDSQTDYYASKTTKTLILGFSKSGRNSFAEMRKAIAAANLDDLPQLKALANEKESEENRETWSMGKGLYLTKKGGSRYSGWQVRKIGHSKVFLSAKDIPAGELRLPAKSAPAPTAAKTDTKIPAEKAESAGGVEVRKNEEKNGLELVFSEKPARDTLEKIKAAGYRWHRAGGYWYAKDNEKTQAIAKAIAAGA